MTKQSIEQLQQSINALQKQLDELKKQQPKPLEMWKPVMSKYWWNIIARGDVSIESVSPCRESYAEANYLFGNCFPTRELAEYYAKRRAARQRLEMLALAENGMVPYEFLHKKDDACNYYIGWYEGGQYVCVMDFSVINPGTQYFPTRAAAQRVLAAMTDDDLITLFGTANRGGKQ